MPNTLIHIAIQAPISKSVFPRIEIPWILAGTIIPDIPWIFQRLLPLFSNVDLYQARLYFTVQASFFCSLLLCMVLAPFAKRPVQVFFLLTGNCLLHLFLDALQIKWGNGVHLLAPFSWHSTNIGILWPEHALGYIFSLGGLIYLLLTFRKIVKESIFLNPSPSWFICLTFLALYFTAPIFFMGQLEESNSNYIKTLGLADHRPGQNVEIDRPYFSKNDATLSLFNGETIRVEGDLPERSGTVSIQGKFNEAGILLAKNYHAHNGYRDHASVVGLVATLLLWSTLIFPKLSKLLRNRNKR